MEWLAEHFRWMQWNWAGTLFFAFLCLSITGLTIWDVLRPDTGRKGFLPISTTRGDRLFIGIMSSIGLLLIWLALVGNTALAAVFVILLAWNVVLALRG
jgi:predicted small integral membrane protein